MNMKKLIESMDKIEECGMSEMGEMPSMSPQAPAPEMDKGNPVTVNVSMNASGKEHVADLLDMMKNAGLGDAAPAADAMMSPRMDMERLSGMMDTPDDHKGHEHDLPAIADLDGGEDESYANEMELEGGLEDDPCPACEGEGCDECDNTGMAGVTGDIDKYEDLAADMDMGDEEAETEDSGAYEKSDPKHPQFKANYTKWKAKNPSGTLAQFISAMKESSAVEDMSDEGTYTVKVKGKDMDSQNELARLAGLAVKYNATIEDDVEEADGGGFEDATTEPNPQHGDMSDAIPDGNDLHKQKKSHPATAGGDNPMAIENIKAALYAALTEKKMSEGEVPAGLKAYQAKKGKGKAPAKGKSKSGKMPMDAGKDGKKGTKDDKPAFLKKEEMTAEGRGKVMAGKGRGKKPKLMAGRGRGKQ